MHRSTTQLLKLFLNQGDEKAYEELVLRYQPSLKRFVEARLGASLKGRVTADDIVQQAQLEALKGLPSFEYRQPRAFFYWLCGIARNLIRSQARRGEREGVSVSLDAPPESDPESSRLLACLEDVDCDPGEHAERAQEAHVLALALTELPERRRRAVLLRHVEGLGSESCAERLDTSPGAFRVLLSRAMSELREQVDLLLAQGAGA